MMEKKTMSAVEYLNQIQKRKMQVRKLRARVQNLEYMAKDIANYMTGSQRSGQADRDKTGTLIAEKRDAEKELAEAEATTAQIIDEVGTIISRIENQNTRDVIRLRYVDGMKYDDIAEKKGFCVQRVYQLRRKGIEDVEMIRRNNALQ